MLKRRRKKNGENVAIEEKAGRILAYLFLTATSLAAGLLTYILRNFSCKGDVAETVPHQGQELEED